MQKTLPDAFVDLLEGNLATPGGVLLVLEGWGVRSRASGYALAVNWREHISIDPGVMAGKPVFRGTRLAVEFVLELLSRGWSEAQICAEYPGLQRADILACRAYAAETTK